MGIGQIATELGIRRSEAEKLLRVHSWWLRASPAGKPVTYDATVIEKLRGLLDQPHRQLEQPESDWLSRYLGVDDASSEARLRLRPTVAAEEAPPRPPEAGREGG